jgi:hypothetical protein
LMPDLSQPHRQLARLYMETGREKEAAAEAAIVRNLASGGQQKAEMPPATRMLFQVRRGGS